MYFLNYEHIKDNRTVRLWNLCFVKGVLFFKVLSLVTQVLAFFFSPSQNQGIYLSLDHRLITMDLFREHLIAVWLMELTNPEGRDLRWKDRQLGVWALTNMIINFLSWWCVWFIFDPILMNTLFFLFQHWLNILIHSFNKYFTTRHLSYMSPMW